MRENRNLTRWRLIYYLRVFDDTTGALLGHIVDITVEGMMLVSADPIPIDQDFHLRMDVPVDANERQTLMLKARSLWTDSDPNQDFHDTGFRFDDPSEDTVLAIQTLIDQLRFPGSERAGEGIYGLSSFKL